jgi:hypothetical protein
MWETPGNGEVSGNMKKERKLTSKNNIFDFLNYCFIIHPL